MDSTHHNQWPTHERGLHPHLANNTENHEGEEPGSVLAQGTSHFSFDSKNKGRGKNLSHSQSKTPLRAFT